MSRLFIMYRSLLAPIRSKISRKIFAGVAGSCMIVMAAALTIVELQSYEFALAELAESQTVITQGQSIVAGELMDDLDEERLLLALSGTLAHPDIVGVALRNAQGATLVEFGQTDPQAQGIYTHAQTIHAFRDDDFVQIGSLQTFASDRRIVEAWQDGMRDSAIVIALAALAIIVATLSSVHWVVGRAITKMVDAIRAPETQSARQVEWASDDEIGLVTSEFNTLQRKMFNRIDDLALELSDRDRREAERLRLLVDVAFEGIVIVSDGKIVEANLAFVEMTGTSKGEVEGSRLDRWLADDPIDANFQGARLGSSHRTARTQLNSISARSTAIEVICREIDYRGRPAQALALRDITERLVTEDRIRHLALHDDLTGLPNRRAFQQTLSARMENRQKPFALLSLDLDGFKPVNDQWGHSAGDEILVAFGKRLRNVVSQSDFVARLGGDEFAIIHEPGPNVRESSETLAKYLVQVVASAFQLSQCTIHIGVSIGVAIATSNRHQTMNEFIRQSDDALYAAKRNGRNTYRFAPDAALADALN